MLQLEARAKSRFHLGVAVFLAVMALALYREAQLLPAGLLALGALMAFVQSRLTRVGLID